MNTQKTLERAAIDAHARGLSWSQFWTEHAEAVRGAEPVNVRRYHRLVAHLLHLLTTGDASGEQAIGEPWLLDDAPGRAEDGREGKGGTEVAAIASGYRAPAPVAAE